MAGTRSPYGWVAAGLSLVLVGYGVFALRGGGLPSGAHVAGVLATLGLWGVAAVAVVAILVAESDMREKMAASNDDAFGIGRAMSEATQVNLGPGLWLLILAGLVGLISTCLALGSRRA